MTLDDLRAYRMLIEELDRYTRQQVAQMRPGESTSSFVNRAVEARGIAWRPMILPGGSSNSPSQRLSVMPSPASEHGSRVTT